MPVSPKELLSVYDHLDTAGIQTTKDLVEAPLEVELEFVRHLLRVWDNDLVEPIRAAPIKKFALYLDSPVTDLIVKHSSSYSEYSFFITPAVTTLDTSDDITSPVIKQQPEEWFEASRYRFPRGIAETLHQVRPMVEKGLAMVLPTWVDGAGLDRGNVTYQWPLVRDHNTVDINMTRFREVNPLLYAGEYPAAFLELKVPVLLGVPLDTIHKIREDESDAFRRFIKRFFDMVKEHEEELESENALANAITEVDDAIWELEERYKSICRSRLTGIAEASVALGVTCLCLFLPPEISKFMAALFGGKAGATALHAFGKYRESLDNLRGDEFYVPWLIAHEAGVAAT